MDWLDNIGDIHLPWGQMYKTGKEAYEVFVEPELEKVNLKKAKNRLEKEKTYTLSDSKKRVLDRLIKKI